MGTPMLQHIIYISCLVGYVSYQQVEIITGIILRWSETINQLVTWPTLILIRAACINEARERSEPFFPWLTCY